MPTYLHITLEDGYGRTTHKRIEMTNQLLLADYVMNAETLLTALDTITDLSIVKAAIATDDGLTWNTKDPGTSNVDVGATFSGWVGGTPGKKASLKVPGIDLSYVGAQGVIDVTDVDIFAYLDLFGDPPDNKFKVSDGEYIETWIQGTLDR